MAKNIGLKKVEDWGFRNLDFVAEGGRKIFKKEIKEVAVQESSRFCSFIDTIIQLFPSIKKGVENGVKKTAENLDTKVGETYFKNIVEFTGEILRNMCKKRSVEYTAKVASNTNNYLKSIYKFISIILSAIGSTLDYLVIFMLGKNAVKYFEDYITRTLGSDYVIKQKKLMSKYLII